MAEPEVVTPGCLLFSSNMGLTSPELFLPMRYRAASEPADTFWFVIMHGLFLSIPGSPRMQYVCLLGLPGNSLIMSAAQMSAGVTLSFKS